MNDLIAPTGNTDHGAFSNFDSVSNATNGLKMLDPAVDAGAALMRGDFVEAGVNGVSAALDVVGMIFNPLAGVVSMAANWIMEHCGPLQDWLDELLGDPAVISAAATTWNNVADHLRTVADQLVEAVNLDLAEYHGLTMEAYRNYVGVQAKLMSGMGSLSDGVSAAVTLAGGILAGVRDFIQGVFSDLIGAAVDAVAKSALTLGIAAPGCLAGLIAKARSILEKCRTFMKALSTTLSNMAVLISDISPNMSAATRFVAQIANDSLSKPVEYALNFSVSQSKGLTGINAPA